MEASAQMIPLADMKNSMLYDGVHPNREGYSWIASRVYEEMAL
jgi:lysophospholipase L1-like esterase